MSLCSAISLAQTKNAVFIKRWMAVRHGPTSSLLMRTPVLLISLLIILTQRLFMRLHTNADGHRRDLMVVVQGLVSGRQSIRVRAGKNSRVADCLKPY